MARFNSEKMNTDFTVKPIVVTRIPDSTPTRICSVCKQEKPSTKDYFLTRADRPWLFLAGCRDCRNKKRDEHRYKRYDLYLKELKVRSAVRCRRCLVCRIKGDLYWYNIQGKKALYHKRCAEQRYYAIGDIPPERKKQLQEIAGTDGIFERTF